jgi:hypothetical protein
MDDPTTFLTLSGRRARVTPEAALLFLTANVFACQEHAGRVGQLLCAPLDWPSLLALGEQHGVLGLLRCHLRGQGHWQRIPAQVRRSLDLWYHDARVMYVKRTHQLARLLDAAASAGISPVVLKGAAVAPTVYPDPSLRVMADLDLLVPEGETPALLGALVHIGYIRQEFFYTDDFNADRGYHQILEVPGDPTSRVELHWGLASRLERRNALSARALLRRTTWADVVTLPNSIRRRARILAPAAQLVHLATHAATEGHAFGRLNWLADIAALVGSPLAPPWASVIGFARLARASAAVFIALALARSLLDAAVPARVLHQLRPGWLPLTVLERTLHPTTLLAPTTLEQRGIVKYLVVDSPALTARLLCERFVPPSSILRTYYPPAAHSPLALIYLRHAGGVGLAAMQKGLSWLRRG